MYRNVLQYLEASAKTHPDKEVYLDEAGALTFSALQAQAMAVGSYLTQYTPPRHPVVVMMEKSAACLMAFMGIVYAGCFYVPIDSKMPVSRIHLILDTLKPACVIQDKKHAAMIEEIAPECPIVSVEEAREASVREQALKDIRAQQTDTDLLYVLFTSGSTGVPKGVMICHRAVIDFMDWACEKLGYTEDTHFGNQGDFHFDLSVMDIYCPLQLGGSMYITPQKCFSFPKLMMAFLWEHRIDTVFWVPSALVLIANSGVLEKTENICLEKIYFCGEVMPNKALNVWRRRLPQATYCNMYGSTEATDACAYYIPDRSFEDDESLPIGAPCANTRILLLTDDDKEAQPGEMGEICILGASLSSGYYNNPERIRAAFVQNPLNPYFDEIMYRTGGLARLNKRGELIYICRKDFQIKLHGHRIELGEIETALCALPGVGNGCCLFDETKEQIVCFYSGEMDEKALLAALQGKLPQYMIPGVSCAFRACPRRSTVRSTVCGCAESISMSETMHPFASTEEYARPTPQEIEETLRHGGFVAQHTFVRLWAGADALANAAATPCPAPQLAVQGDMEDIATLLKAGFDPLYDVVPDMQTLKKRIEGKLAFLVRAEDALAAVLLMNDISAGSLELSHLLVDPRYRGRGYGKILSRQMLRAAGERGMRNAVVWTNQNNAVAKSTYEGVGFQTDGRMVRKYRYIQD